MESFGVSEIGVFGSFARKANNRNSDIDILVDFQIGMKTFDNFMNLKFYLEDLFGRKVDLVTKSALKPRMRDVVLKEVIYA
ncbi:nucleotidyltransferase family protein [Pseudothermotoga thermarum]|uniref:nucleotidyltransferase family protein n=1 Tax=Pseudothermotoga thermarum TaxID=119394 RepID=UPI000A050F5C|nr:nucleotidyltransferase family protein [Pseudothermotoga thermarum]